MPNKPIDEGYKIFAICDHSYTYGLELHSRVDGSSGTIGLPAEALTEPGVYLPIPTPVGHTGNLTTTSTTCLRLAQVLPYHQWPYTIYFDTFFSNTALFATLRELRTGACGTARKNQVLVEHKSTVLIVRLSGVTELQFPRTMFCVHGGRVMLAPHSDYNPWPQRWCSCKLKMTKGRQSCCL